MHCKYEFFRIISWSCTRSLETSWSALSLPPLSLKQASTAPQRCVRRLQSQPRDSLCCLPCRYCHRLSIRRVVHVRYLILMLSTLATHARERLKAIYSRSNLRMVHNSGFLYLCLSVSTFSLLEEGILTETLVLLLLNGESNVCLWDRSANRPAAFFVLNGNKLSPRSAAPAASVASLQGNGMTSLTQL